MAGITQPFEFRRFIGCAPKAGFDFVPYLDVVLIVLFISINASPFIIAPGTAIELPRSGSAIQELGSPSAVLTVDRNQLYFFEGTKLSQLTLADHLRAYVEDYTLVPDQPDPTLLIKADTALSTKMLFHLMDLARDAGFSRVNLAAEPAISQGEADGWDESEGGGEP